jgi:uncharacterized protein YlxP (DUF503 family)
MTVGLCRSGCASREPVPQGQAPGPQVLIARIHNRFNVSAAEIDDHDSWQMASLGISCVSTSADHAHQVLSKVVAFIHNERPDAEIVDYRIEMVHALGEGSFENGL